MADEISIGSKAIKEIQELKNELVLADNALLKLSQTALSASKNISVISTPGGLGKSTNDNAKTLQDLEALKAKYTALNDTIVKKAEQSRLAEIRLQQQREKAFDSFEKNAKKEQAIVEKNNQLYTKTQNQINTLTKTYNELATRKERYNNLSANEEMRLGTLQRVTEKYNGVLKSVDATAGKHFRNVGNYASGYNALGNSINQLTREAPAFANSINTGFMAISNNIPALTDAIKGIREQNALLRAEGKPIVSTFKQLTGGILSWQTAISLGVTLLTIYGGKMVELVGNLIKGENASRSFAENQKDLNDAVKEGNKDASKEISQLDILYKTATNVALSTHQRLKAVNKLQETYPSYFADIDDEIIMNGKATKSYEALREAIFDSARAKAVQSKLEERASERLDKELELRESIAEIEGKLAKQRADPKAVYGGEDNAEIMSAKSFTLTLSNILKERKKALVDFRKSALTEDDLLLKAKEKFEANSAVLEADRIKEPKERKARVKKERRDEIEGLKSHLKTVGTLMQELDIELERLSVERVVASDTERPAIIEQIRLLNLLKDQLQGLPTADTEIRVAVRSEDIEKVNELSDAIKNYLKSFSSEFMSNSGFSETFAMLNGEIEGFGENWTVTTLAIMESAQEMFNFISNASQRNFEAEKERAQNQYDVALTYAGDNKAAQEKLALDLEAQKKEIANRENKAKQKQAIFNIAVDTAQAIIGLWANPGFPAAIPLALLVGALGATQIAMVASQEVPQYWMGGTHDGGLMMVNDGSGSNYKETIVTPDGKIIQPKGRNVLMDAPAGTEIFTQDQWNMELQNMLQGKGISMNSNHSYSGISKSDLEEVMIRTLGNQEKRVTKFDANGASEYVEKRGNITKRNIARGNGRGIKY